MKVGKKIEDLEREKIFMPFDALKGFRQALQEKEMFSEPKVDLTEETQQELSLKLSTLKKHDIVTIKFYSVNAYTTLSGEITELNFPYQYLKIYNSKISFDAIICIENESCK